MANPREPPLDEIQFRREDVLGYWGGVHSNSIHGYLKESPFFDHTSRNGLLWEHAFLDPHTFQLCADRQRFEATLREKSGLEFMVTGEPQPSSNPASQGPDTGIWNIRKQERSKRDRPLEDDLTVLGTYYAVADNLYQAPSVYDVVGNHVASAVTSLNKFIDETGSLSTFNPATGYSYLSAEQEDTTTTDNEEQLVPGLDPTVTEELQAPPATDKLSAAKQDYLMQQSLLLMRDHGDEYMDLNPLVGEPGNFVFSHTKAHVKARQAEQSAAALKAELALAEKQAKSKTSTPAAFTTTIKTEEQEAVSPTIKTEQPSGTQKVKKLSKSDGSGKKRRKSKAVGALSAKSSPVVGRSPTAS